ncbi:MAG: zinc finger domain-containing protein, partial [Planctomycetota bacterium]
GGTVKEIKDDVALVQLDNGDLIDAKPVNVTQAGERTTISIRPERVELNRDRLGPDALRISIDELRDRLKSSRREIKVALLDQRAVAGIGNLYASEILHLAGVHPQKRCDQLKGDAWKDIHKSMYRVLETAIKYEGSTLGDGTYRNALNQDGSYQNEHRVYMRESESCMSCDGGLIKKIVQAQRSTFFCPTCQKKSGRK